MSFKDSKIIRNKFLNWIKIGTAKDRVLEVMGTQPSRIVDDTWYYSEVRAPNPGEQLSIYVITFFNNKVKKAEILPGPDSTGAAQK